MLVVSVSMWAPAGALDWLKERRVDWGLTQSVLAGDTDNMVSHRQYLETSFWTEDTSHDSDDEGIGSDESVDQADHQCNCSAKPVARTREMSQQTKESSLSVTKFLRVLKQSVKRDTGLRSPSVQSPTVVFGLDLASHLSASKTSVPDVVRRVSLSNCVWAARCWLWLAYNITPISYHLGPARNVGVLITDPSVWPISRSVFIHKYKDNFQPSNSQHWDLFCSLSCRPLRPLYGPDKRFKALGQLRSNVQFWDWTIHQMGGSLYHFTSIPVVHLQSTSPTSIVLFPYLWILLHSFQVWDWEM